MKLQIVDASPAAKAKITSYEDKVGLGKNESPSLKYPFEEMKIGECFTIPIKNNSESSIRVSAARKGKELNKKFCVIKHKDFEVIEVARIG